MQIKFKCAVYTRVSTDSQAEKVFNSCEAQEEKIRAFIKSQENMEVYKVYSDAGYTGANTERPALQELLKDVSRNKINLVMSYKIDRLTRSPRDFYQLVEYFERHNVDFISVTERFDTSTPSGRLLRNIMLTFAQFERELISERTRDKMLQRAQKGMWNGGMVPLGYKRENKQLVIDKRCAEIVKNIFERYIETGSLVKVYQDLKSRKIKDDDGVSFSKSRIHYMLRNINYTGKMEYSKKIYQGLHEPIISEDMFNLAQKAHQHKGQIMRMYKQFPLGGLLKCAECGSYMTPHFANKRNGNGRKRYHYYRCTKTFKDSWDSCSTKQVSATRLEDYVFQNIERISLDRHYVDSSIFALKNGHPGDHSGLEPSEEWADLTPEMFQDTLKTFIKGLAEKRGLEKNLWVKKFIKNIVYSKEQIELSLFYSTTFKARALEVLPTRQQRVGVENEKRTPGPKAENPQFDLLKMAPRGDGGANHPLGRVRLRL